MRNRILTAGIFCVLFALLLIGTVSAVPPPVTGAVTNLTAGSATFNAVGSGNEGWFEWGSFSGGYYKWLTPNQTYSGSFSMVQLGSPMLTGETYYVRACDNIGCGNEVTWTVPTSTVPNRTSYGAGLITMMRSGFDISTVLTTITTPYTATTPGGAPVVWGLLFFFIIAGYWLRQREIFIPMLLAIFAGGLVWFGTATLGVPPEFAHIGQGLFIAAVAGLFVSWFSK